MVLEIFEAALGFAAGSELNIAYCRDCGAKRRTKFFTFGLSDSFVNVCWLCGAAADDSVPVVEPPVASAERRSMVTFALSTLMVIVALCAVLFAVFWEWPPVGALLAIVLGPAMGATIVDAVKREVWGRPMTVWGMLGTFAATTGLIVALPVAVFVVAVAVVLAIVFLR